MEASKVTFSRETRLMLSSPLFKNRKRKANLRVNRVKEFVQSRPSGTQLKMEDLIYAAGYDHQQYASGWAFIKRLIDNKVIIVDKVSGKRKFTVTIPDNTPSDDVAKSNVYPVKRVSDLPQDTTPGSGDEVVNTTQSDEIDEITFKVRVKLLAKDFAWRENSNDLREFIKWLV